MPYVKYLNYLNCQSNELKRLLYSLTMLYYKYYENFTCNVLNNPVYHSIKICRKSYFYLAELTFDGCASLRVGVC